MRKWLYDKRKKKKMSQAEVAEKCGIARTTYAMIEVGERNPSPEVAMKIATTLKTRWTYFFAPPTTQSEADNAPSVLEA